MHPYYSMRSGPQTCITVLYTDPIFASKFDTSCVVVVKIAPVTLLGIRYETCVQVQSIVQTGLKDLVVVETYKYLVFVLMCISSKHVFVGDCSWNTQG